MTYSRISFQSKEGLIPFALRERQLGDRCLTTLIRQREAWMEVYHGNQPLLSSDNVVQERIRIG